MDARVCQCIRKQRLTRPTYPWFLSPVSGRGGKVVVKGEAGGGVQQGKVYQSPVRKVVHPDRAVHTPGADPNAPSFMRDTCSSTQKHIDVSEAPRTPPCTP